MRESGGTVLRADVSVDADGKSKGFGSVVFETVDEARRAAEMFNGREYSGRILQVHQDRNARSEQTTMEGRQLFITNLPYQMRWQDLKTMFRDCGNVVRADVLLKSDGRSKGLGVVVFEKREEAEIAIRGSSRVHFLSFFS
jgi:RNA recognition motif-containing protein